MVKDAIQLGEPVEHRGIVVAPLFPRSDPRAEYVTLDEALPLGFAVTEVDAAGSVPELAVDNPLDSHVLLYDGEELVGAKQNRILNVSVLVGARSKTRIPVSCVEQGRWSSRSARFGAASHTAYPELRRRKAHTLLSAPLARGVAQSGGLGVGRRQGAAARRALADRRAGRHLRQALRRISARSARPSRSSRGRPVRCSRSATASASTTCRGRRRSRASTRSC